MVGPISLEVGRQELFIHTYRYTHSASMSESGSRSESATHGALSDVFDEGPSAGASEEVIAKLMAQMRDTQLEMKHKDVLIRNLQQTPVSMDHANASASAIMTGRRLSLPSMHQHTQSMRIQEYNTDSCRSPTASSMTAEESTCSDATMDDTGMPIVSRKLNVKDYGYSSRKQLFGAFLAGMWQAMIVAYNTKHMMNLGNVGARARQACTAVADTILRTAVKRL